MIDFLIMYEVRVRELESIILLGTELKNRGYSVEYLSFDDVDQNKYIKNRGMLKKYFNNVKTVLVPSLYHDSEVYNTVYYVCGTVPKVINLRWEQYFPNYEMADPKSFPFPHESALNAYHVCWGQVSYDSLVESGVKKKNLLLTGPLQMDFLRDDFSGFYMKKEKLLTKYGINKKAKTMLYISSFATATRTERLFAHVQKDFNDQYNEDERVYGFECKSYEITLQWIEKYLKKHPDIVFIYRPHPAENITDLIECIQSEYKNFYIISDYSVKQWILTCDVITTWVSTSIAEAYFAGKPCYIIRPLPYDEDLDMCIYKNAKFIDKEEDFLEITSEKKEYSVSGEMMETYYSVEPKTASYIRLANELESIISNNNTFTWKGNLIKNFEKKRKKIIVRNIMFSVYLKILIFLGIFRKHLNVSFGSGLNARIDNYLINRKKSSYEIENNRSFHQIKKRVDKVLKKIENN